MSTPRVVILPPETLLVMFDDLVEQMRQKCVRRIAAKIERDMTAPDFGPSDCRLMYPYFLTYQSPAKAGYFPLPKPAGDSPTMDEDRAAQDPAHREHVS